MNWDKVVKHRTWGEELQREGVREFNDAAAAGSDKGRKAAQDKIKKGDDVLRQAAEMAREVHEAARKN
jgi:hypothetical protein